MVASHSPRRCRTRSHTNTCGYARRAVHRCCLQGTEERSPYIPWRVIFVICWMQSSFGATEAAIPYGSAGCFRQDFSAQCKRHSECPVRPRLLLYNIVVFRYHLLLIHDTGEGSASSTFTKPAIIMQAGGDDGADQFLLWVPYAGCILGNCLQHVKCILQARLRGPSGHAGLTRYSYGDDGATYRDGVQRTSSAPWWASGTVLGGTIADELLCADTSLWNPQTTMEKRSLPHVHESGGRTHPYTGSVATPSKP